MRNKTIAWVLGLSLSIPLSHAASLTQKLDAIIEAQLPHATVGIMVKDAQTGQIVYSKNPDKLLALASSTKIFTAAAALYQLSPAYHFLTTLSQKDNTYYLTFSGSPSLTAANLDELLQNLQHRGITTIEGDIVIDSARYQVPDYPAGVSIDDLGWYYAAPDSAIIINENAQTYEFISDEKIGSPVTIEPQIPGPGLVIVNDVQTVTQEQAQDHCDLNIDIQPHNTLHLFGCMAQSKEPKIMRLAIPEPFLLAKQLIEKDLTEKGITLKGQIKAGYTPSDAKVLASFQSDDLSDLVSHMLKTSDNVYANSLTKLLGYVVTGEGTYKQGAYAIKKILTQHTTMDTTQLVLKDGMGTRYNLTTPVQMVTLLEDMYHDNDMQSLFLNALPQAGVSGTLKDRMKATPLEKNVFAKTGTMHDISSLSGYIINPKGRTLVFSVIINGIDTPISTAKHLEEQVLLVVNSEKL